MSIYQPLKELVESYLAPEQCAFIYKAYQHASVAHEGVTRASGDPYITHPVAVAEILADMQLDHESIAAALLHDVIEDTATTQKELKEQFNSTVADLVQGMTKLAKVDYKNKEQAQAENIRKMLIAMSKDFRVMLIKLADRAHNMRTLQSLRPEKRFRIAQETFDIFTPIAERLGLHNLKTELQDLAFHAQHPARYNILKAAITKARGNRKDFIEQMCHEISERLTRVGITFNVTGREKHLYSLYKKMQRKGCNFHDVMDIYAFRVVVQDLDTCYRVLGQIHLLYKPKINLFKDYIALPKPNSYQSIHTTLVTHHGVNIEIQIRTTAMDNVAKYGIAAHWSYKDGQTNTKATMQLQARNWFQGLGDPLNNTTNSLLLLKSLKRELGNNEVHVLTPQGEIIVLPSQATPVDFAYALHTDIGHRCKGAKVDGEFSMLTSKLESGQTVQILLSQRTKPNAQWLNFVATHRARNAIRHYLKQQPRKVAIPAGRRLLKQALNTTSISEISQKNIDKVVMDQNLNSFDDLLNDIGCGKIMSILIARLLRGNTRELTESEIRQENRQSAVKGTENLMTSYAKCCRPLPGDEIVAHVTPSKGIVVHIRNCYAVSNLKTEPDKYICVEWDEDFFNQYEYIAALDITLKNHQPDLVKLFTAIAKSNANILEIQTSAQLDDIYLVNLKLTVLNRIHLSRVMRKLKNIPHVKRITRNAPKAFIERRRSTEKQKKEKEKNEFH